MSNKSPLDHQQNRETARTEAECRVLIAKNRENILRSSLFDQVARMAITGYECWEDPETGLVVDGDKLPLDLREHYLKLLANKTMPSPKEVTHKDESDNVSLLKQLIQEEKDEKKNRHIENIPVLEDTIDIDCD